MTYEDIYYMALINEVDEEIVNKIADSIRENGWTGCPILIFNDQLFTGSHRLAALKQLCDDGFDVDSLGDIAEDVTDIVNDNYDKWVAENGWAPDIEMDNIGWLLKDSWVEEYKDEICEW